MTEVAQTSETQCVYRSGCTTPIACSSVGYCQRGRREGLTSNTTLREWFDDWRDHLPAQAVAEFDSIVGPAHEACEQHPAVPLLKEADYWLDELRRKGYAVGALQDRIHAITAPDDDSHNGILVRRGTPWPPEDKR